MGSGLAWPRRAVGRSWRAAAPRAASAFRPEIRTAQTPPLPPNPPLLERLTKRAQFLHVRGGRRASGAHVLIEGRRRASAGLIGVGFTATKKIGGAVIRNRARRRLKEAARRLLPEFGMGGVDYVFVARQSAPDAHWAALLDDVRNALIRLRADLTSGREGEPRRGGKPAPKPSTKSD